MFLVPLQSPGLTLRRIRQVNGSAEFCEEFFDDVELSDEHVVGGGWPMARVRQERLAEAVEIIRALFSGEYVNFQGRHFTVERAKLYDLPDQPPPIGIAVSGPDSVELAARYADAMITVEPDAGLIRGFNEAGGSAKPKYGQLALC